MVSEILCAWLINWFIGKCFRFVFGSQGFCRGLQVVLVAKILG